MPLDQKPSGNLRWSLLGLVTVSHIIGAAAQYAINTLAPFYQPDLNLSRAQVGWFFGAFYLGMAGLSLPAGWLTDRLGVRQTALTGHFFLGLFTLGASFAQSFPWALISFFLAGLGYSFLNPATTRGVMLWFQREERGTAMGIKQTGVPGGGVTTALLAPVLVLWLGWRHALVTLGLLNLSFGFLFWLLWLDPNDRAEQENFTRPMEKFPMWVPAILELRGILALSFTTAILLVGQMSLLTYVPLYLKEAMGYPAYRASQALAFTQAGAVVGRIGWGVVSDRLFHGRRKIVLVIIALMSAMFTFALGLLPPNAPLRLVAPFLFLAGLCLVGYQGVSYALTGELAGKARTATALGFLITVNSLATILGTPLFGYLVDMTTSYALAWRSLAAFILSGTLCMATLIEEPRE